MNQTNKQIVSSEIEEIISKDTSKFLPTNSTNRKGFSIDNLLRSSTETNMQDLNKEGISTLGDSDADEEEYENMNSKDVNDFRKSKGDQI